jgi:hypothetical protein
MRRKAMLAIAFAGGILNPQLPAFTQGKLDRTNSVINEIVNDAQGSPEVRAFNLLSLASRYHTGGDRAALEAQFRSDGINQAIRSRAFNNTKRWENLLTNWAEQLSFEVHSQDHLPILKGVTSPSRQPVSKEQALLAKTAIQEGLKQLDESPEIFAKLNMYFVASCLFQKLEYSHGVKRCNDVLEKSFQSCESSRNIDREEIKAATSVLNSMAFGLVPIGDSVTSFVT